ncbi:MAG: PAS domain S-box protein [Bacteroidia bacterium]|nr:PAS domain S-box protein [Bacteroidia bacterium]
MNLAQQELAEKEANLDALINNMSHAIIAFDKQYKITVVNRAMRQLYTEYGARLEVGKNFLEEMPRDEVEKYQAEYQKVLEGHKFEMQREVEKYNRRFFYELHYNPIRNENKEIIGASIFMENITEQKLADMQLKEAEANLTSLINDTEDSIMALDNYYRVIVANEAYKMNLNSRALS